MSLGHTRVMEPQGDPGSDSESTSSSHSAGDGGEQVEVGEHVEVIPPDTPTVASSLVDASEVQKEPALVIPSNTLARANLLSSLPLKPTSPLLQRLSS